MSDSWHIMTIEVTLAETLETVKCYKLTFNELTVTDWQSRIKKGNCSLENDAMH